MEIGIPFQRITDVGIVGIHRLFAKQEVLTRCTGLIVIAWMEGALPSVVGGLVDIPAIAVPTSIGYGSSLQGPAAALFAMLNPALLASPYATSTTDSERHALLQESSVLIQHHESFTLFRSSSPPPPAHSLFPRDKNQVHLPP
ncbi:hypothetical protein BCY86_02850 [Pajaroellobacter abortibovis]|uniref:PurE domain-containing protein n=1 Tax=Pajaroellobacter abortibovis TaxID=1882918 RepID=A0A1L6MW08_9BACT|nr:hypothetical protein [Pajaroellobacter abortibovis]APR99729.1 hypothetical protein BCY86_02850 [Pajaroellobacter abortibovis]